MNKFSQNSPFWKNVKMGISNCTLGRFGCTSSSLATLGSWFGDTLTPESYANRKNLYTLGGYILWTQIEKISKKIKFKWRNWGFDEKMIDKYLIKNPNTGVVANVDFGYHWVALLKKTKKGYLASDPYPYPVKDREYLKSDIVGFAVIEKK